MPFQKYERPLNRFDEVVDRWRRVRRDGGVAAFSAAVAIATHTLFPLLRWMQRRRIDRGETIWLDDLPGPAPTQTFSELPLVPADLTPNPGKVRRKARHMKVEYPPMAYPFAYRQPPISGNTINGLGETTPRRAHHVFFGDAYKRAWGKLDWYFQIMEPTAIHRIIVRMFWQDRRRVGPVARQSTITMPPDEAAAQIKALARQRGAALVGITPLTENLCYHDFDPPFAYAIAIAIPMDREEMLHTPSERSNREIMRTYLDVNRVAIEVAEQIRKMGWPAQASTNLAPDSSVEVLHVPVAIQAGLGQLGKHGSMITPEYGSNVRLATVLTDMPLAIDQPRDIGVDDFCATCRICETNCPPHAISPEKQMVRGMERWYVNFDKCAPYFAETRGCGICIEVCPWSEPGRGPSMVKTLLERRGQRSSAV
ncbi:reductive dehalogenase domain-containing protein [Leptolyngbya sp. CCNP1308]|uniref:4Fe-4S dicluster domain-containing protein n=1 Tax=Leptolyngbya sp. CCNP1308 TaxID=3110255 RepID=UPI002B1FA4D4|nr:reductive dehalogenase domain-containing protein [Leptolyngbya sp. CCNP1308]MEA5449419.1 reductive dehalogenase domain-containing protein [Leptolyngbya sp. CCNP1308]